MQRKSADRAAKAMKGVPQDELEDVSRWVFGGLRDEVRELGAGHGGSREGKLDRRQGDANKTAQGLKG
eukprot:CAMPEP_0206220820 /NCGR_PEP_ID=MMETSP0047_2-20121206/5081_1 /ASSEMBLY_ACC=CAM_ASM_000192 /TAXON_ID=195065 /ORGANISM="Chroomonas mesostigmatica_cf, Strain CCMP1168" /LENGTH=67 /DNA_ID=CAMNT_0053643505 /DNA_START=60 /DNA_END=265 /DNA_ORIENTATION=+